MAFWTSFVVVCSTVCMNYDTVVCCFDLIALNSNSHHSLRV